MTPTKLQMSLKVRKYNFVLKYRISLHLFNIHLAGPANFPCLHHQSLL